MTHLPAPFLVHIPYGSSSRHRHGGKRTRVMVLAAASILAALGSSSGRAQTVQGSGIAAGDGINAAASNTPTGLRLSNGAFDFGPAFVGVPSVKTIAVLTNTSSATVPVQTLLSGDAGYTMMSGDGCGATLAAGASCNLKMSYSPRTASAPALQRATLLVSSVQGKKFTYYTLALSGSSGTLPTGVVTPTSNSMVANYAMTLPFPGAWSVAFGQTTNYGLTTNTVSNSVAGAANSIYVAGMQANTTYHMRATVTLPNGVTVTDNDHTFTTGALPAGIIPPMTVTTTPGLTPQPGVELIDTIIGGTATAAYATDLAGNVIWTYAVPDRQYNSLLYPIKLMPNGNMLMLIAPVSQQTAPVPATDLNVLRETDLVGNTVQELSMATLNTRLQAAGHPDLTLQVFSHDVTLLPNGHILVMANTFKPFTDLPGYPGVTNVLGDVVVDLDQNMQPVWVWNAFDHFDVNRHPMGFPDWTHGNAVVYSPDDGNILVSLRHQNWVIKVNYNNGQGDAGTIWKLGYQGDFALVGGTDPQDWFYAQHNPSWFSSNSTGVFSLGLMDNGDDRGFPDGTNCAIQSWRCYSAIPVMRVDEVGKTATIAWRQTLDPSLYSNFAGDTFPLANGNVEYNLAGTGRDSHVFEVTQDASQQTVWHMHITGTNTYRTERLPSLYPGVQW